MIKSFAQTLRQLRLDAELTQTSLSRLLGVSLSAVQKWEAEIKTPAVITQEGAVARITTYISDNSLLVS